MYKSCIQWRIEIPLRSFFEISVDKFYKICFTNSQFPLTEIPLNEGFFFAFSA